MARGQRAHEGRAVGEGAGAGQPARPGGPRHNDIVEAGVLEGFWDRANATMRGRGRDMGGTRINRGGSRAQPQGTRLTTGGTRISHKGNTVDHRGSKGQPQGEQGQPQGEQVNHRGARRQEMPGGKGGTAFHPDRLGNIRSAWGAYSGARSRLTHSEAEWARLRPQAQAEKPRRRKRLGEPSKR